MEEYSLLLLFFFYFEEYEYDFDSHDFYDDPFDCPYDKDNCLSDSYGYSENNDDINEER